MAVSVEIQEPRIKFNPRETAILHLLAQFYTDEEIADTLKISIRTVYNCIYVIKRLTDIDNRIKLIRYACEHGYGTKKAM